jgi:hypothetical protein
MIETYVFSEELLSVGESELLAELTEFSAREQSQGLTTVFQAVRAHQ